MTRAKSARSTVRKRSRELAPAASCLDDAVIGSDLVGTVVGWNKGAQDLYGYTAEEMIGQSIAIVVPEHLREEGLQSLLEVFGQPPPADNEKVRKREPKILVQVSLNVSPVRNSKEDIVGASTMAHETARRKRREECERLASVVESSDDAIIGQGLDGTICARNLAARRR